MKNKAMIEVVRDLSRPFRITKGKGFHLKDVDRNDTLSFSKEAHKPGAQEAMNSTYLGRNKMGFRERFRTHRFRRRFRHDPWLVLSMATFNFEGGWKRTFNPLRGGATGRC